MARSTNCLRGGTKKKTVFLIGSVEHFFYFSFLNQLQRLHRIYLTYATRVCTVNCFEQNRVHIYEYVIINCMHCTCIIDASERQNSITFTCAHTNIYVCTFFFFFWVAYNKPYYYYLATNYCRYYVSCTNIVQR